MDPSAASLTSLLHGRVYASQACSGLLCMSEAALGQAKEEASTTRPESDNTLLIQVKPKNGEESKSLSAPGSWASQPQDPKGGKHMAKVSPLPIPVAEDGRLTEPDNEAQLKARKLLNDVKRQLGQSQEASGQSGLQLNISQEHWGPAQETSPDTNNAEFPEAEKRVTVTSKDDTKVQKMTTMQSARASVVHLVRIRIRSCMKMSGWYDSNTAVATRKFLRGRTFLIITMVSLVFALFLSDLFSVCEVEGNAAQDVILTVVFAIFLGEFFGLLLTDASYLLGFFFFMDLLGTASMIFDISYLLGTSASEPERRSPDSGQENIIVVRAARATKLGARAGRLSRVLKLLRFMPFLKNDLQDKDVQMARRISSQLMNVISTRVAFLSICIVIVLPFLGMFTYPEVDDSMIAWTQLLSATSTDYYNALSASPQSQADIVAYRTRLHRELDRFSRFYESYSYGPYTVAYGTSSDDGDLFAVSPLTFQQPMSNFTSLFTAPGRKSMIREVTTDNFRANFDLSTPKQLEAIANITLIVFTALTMLVFGLVTSSSISAIALNPLERMLTAVRQQCKEIFRYTDEFKDFQAESEKAENDEEEDYDDDDKAESSEFVLLEKVVKKLTAIAQLAVKTTEVKARDDMGEDEIAQLNWAGQNTAAPPAASTRMSQFASRESKRQVSDDVAEAEETTRQTTQLSGDCATLPQTVVDALQTEDFDAFVTPEDGSYALGVVAMHVIKSYEGCDVWVRANVQDKNLAKFIELVEAGYNPNPYHNWNHALDVLYSVARWMNLIQANLYIPEEKQFWVMIACIGHDLGHIAVNNQYLVETKNEIALRYNDRSPLENMHCARLFQIFQNDAEADIFSQIDRDTYKEMRKGIIQAILHTDFAKHFQMVKELELFFHTNFSFDSPLEMSERFVQVLTDRQQLVINMLVHGADISNPMRPWGICFKYAQLIVEEFFNQGDMEEKAGIPIGMLNNRHTVNIPSGQIGFIEFMIAPMAETMVKIFAPLDGLTENLGSNIQSWMNLWIEESKPEEEAAAKVAAKVEKVVKRMKATTRKERENAQAM
jgi:HD-GYP domain-containing protein (c-di-GMP phosphodiesterase class II)